MFSRVLEEHIKNYLYIYAFLFSVLSSVIIINSRVIINTDGVVYIAASQAFIDHGLSAAKEISSNSFLPILISSVSRITDFSLILSADIVNTLLLSLLTLAYIYLIKQLGGNRTIQLIGAILILLNPSLIGYRESYFRDPGFWAFSIFSLGLLLQYSKRNDILSLVFWVLSLGLAFLFRPEAAVFLLTPLALLRVSDNSFRARLIGVSKLYAGLLILVILSFVIAKLFSLGSLYEGAIEHVTRYLESGEVGTLPFQTMSSGFSSLFDYPYPEEYVWLGLTLSLIPIFISSLAGAVSWPMLITFAYCYYKKVLHFSTNEIFRAYVFFSLLTLIVFLLVMFFITPRYATFAGLLLITALPFGLYKLYAGKADTLKAKIITVALVLILITDCFVSFGHSVAYLSDGINWVKKNTPENSRIISNERNVTYSINKGQTFIESQEVFSAWYKRDVSHILKGYDYFVEDTFWNKDEIILDTFPKAEEIARFTSERGNRLVVYKLH